MHATYVGSQDLNSEPQAYVTSTFFLLFELPFKPVSLFLMAFNVIFDYYNSLITQHNISSFILFVQDCFNYLGNFVYLC